MMDDNKLIQDALGDILIKLNRMEVDSLADSQSIEDVAVKLGYYSELIDKIEEEKHQLNRDLAELSRQNNVYLHKLSEYEKQDNSVNKIGEQDATDTTRGVPGFHGVEVPINPNVTEVPEGTDKLNDELAGVKDGTGILDNIVAGSARLREFDNPDIGLASLDNRQNPEVIVTIKATDTDLSVAIPLGDFQGVEIERVN